jgi:hypothetical protein
MKKYHRAQLPAYLLLCALCISAVLNCYLLLTDDIHVTKSAIADDARMAESEMELHLAQTELAHCQAEQLRKDSLLVTLLRKTPAVQAEL